MLRFIIAVFAVLCAVGAACAEDEFSSARHGPGFSAKWRDIQARMSLDALQLALCRGDPQVCRPEEKQVAAIVEAARGQEGRARIGHINRAVNLAIRPASDLARFGVVDRWSAPSETLQAGAGDCEDYAILKFLILREAGFPESGLKLLIVRQSGSRSLHAVLAARVEEEWLVLDNRGFALARLGDSRYRVLEQLSTEPAEAALASASTADLPPLL